VVPLVPIEVDEGSDRVGPSKSAPSCEFCWNGSSDHPGLEVDDIHMQLHEMPSSTDMIHFEHRLDLWMRHLDRRLNEIGRRRRRRPGNRRACGRRGQKRIKVKVLEAPQAPQIRMTPSPSFQDFCSSPSASRCQSPRAVIKKSQVLEGRASSDPRETPRGKDSLDVPSMGSFPLQMSKSSGVLVKSRLSHSGPFLRMAQKVASETSRSRLDGTDRPARIGPVRSRTEKTCVGRLVMHPLFDYVISVVVICSTLLVGAQVHYEAMTGEEYEPFFICEYTFVGIFIVELAIRIYAEGKSFWTDREVRSWNLFDTFLVLLSVLDIGIGLVFHGDKLPWPGASTAKVLKVIRMARTMRLLRMLRFLGELRVMAKMIVSSLLSLFWLMTLLLALIYVVAIVLTQGVTDYLQEAEPPIISGVVHDKYGSLFKTMWTLFKAMSGGVSWGEVSDPLQRVGTAYFVAFGIYIFFALFSVLNIVTGVFVDGAIELAKRDRDMIVQKQHQSKAAYTHHMQVLLQELDANGDGIITREEFDFAMNQPEIQDYMEALHLDADVCKLLFRLLEEAGAGAVDIDDFMDGMRRLSGEAKSADIHMMMLQNRQVLRLCGHLMDGTTNSVSEAVRFRSIRGNEPP